MSARMYEFVTSTGPKPISTLLFVLLAFLMSAQGQQSQTFTSGSTGADGALDYSVLLPNGGVAVFDPAKFNPPLNPAGDNVFNFTTINIPANVTVRLSGRVLKGPVWWLSSGDVTINGTIDLNGENGSPFAPILDGRTRAMPGAGGFSGGVGGKTDGSATSPVAQPGDGPGGGAGGANRDGCQNPNTEGAGGSFTGNSFLVPLVGGSGGGGGQLGTSNLAQAVYASGGGGGGGAILIASSTSITVNGRISANGGQGGNTGNFCGSGQGGGGAGGAIRLLAPTLGGNGNLSAVGGGGAFNNGIGGPGVIRLEAFNDNSQMGFNGTPFSQGSPFSTFLPAIGPPSIAITSINGVNVSQPPTGNLATPDVSINTASPVQMTIQASNIPPGTVITLHVFSDNNTDQKVQTTPLQGTLQSSTATATVTFPSGFSLQFVKATWSQ